MQRRRKAVEVANPGRVRERFLTAVDDPCASYRDIGAAVFDQMEVEAFNGGTLVGEGLDWGGKVTLTRLDPLLSAGSSAIHSEDLLHRSGSSRNHPNPFTSTTTLQFSLPRASSIGLAVYEDTALIAGLLKRPGPYRGQDS